MMRRYSSSRNFVAGIAIAIAALSTVTGCATRSADESTSSADLDVKMPTDGKAAGDGEVSVNPGATARVSGDVTPADVLEWQKFFKAPPTVDQRGMLEKQISGWSNASKPADILARGRSEQAIGRLPAADASFREVLRREPNNLEALLELAALQLRMRKTARAFDSLTQLRSEIGVQRDVPQALVFRYRYVLALGYLARGDRDKGHKVLSDLIGVDKEFAPGYAALASSYLGLGRDSVAEFIAKRGVDRAKQDAALFNILGVVAERRNDGSSARANFNRALEITPTFGPALVNRSALAVREGELGAAEEDILRALLYDPTNVDALVTLAVVQRRTGRFEAARATLEKAINVDPDNAVARFNLAVLMAQELKKPAVARRLFNEVLQTSSATPEVKDYAKSYLSDLQASAEAL